MPRRFKWMSESQKTKDLHHRGRAPSVAHFKDASRELDLLARKMRESGDLSYAGEAVAILASLPSRVRIDLLVARPISALSRVIEKMENNQERAEQSSGQLPSM